MRPTAKRLLQKARQKAFVVSDLTNIRFLSGCTLSAGVLLITDASSALYVDARYAEAAKRDAVRGVRVKPFEEFWSDCAACRRVGVEADHVTLAMLSRWKKRCPKTRFSPVAGVVEECRRQKSREELRLLKRAESITRTLLRAVPSLLCVGMSERDLAWKLESLARTLGADAMSFDTIVAFGDHSSSPHHRPTARKLRTGDIVQIDLGAAVGGYCGDLSDVFFTAPRTAEQTKVYRALQKAKKAATSRMKAGVDVRTVDRAARDVLRRENLEEYFTHALGHGVGLAVHEGVTVSSRGGRTTLLRHEVVTVEPGVYFPGRFGMRLEDMVFVT